MDFFTSLRRKPWFWILCGSVALLIVVATVLLGISAAPASVRSIVLDRNEVTFSSLLSTHRLVATTDPADVDPEDLIWTSSDPAVVTVSENGLLTPKSNGSAVITVVGARGEGKAECHVEVLSVLSLDLAETEVYLGFASSQVLQYLCDPAAVDPLQLVWTSSDPTVVSVDPYGKVTGVSIGKATVTLSSADGTVSDTCTVTVTEHVPVEGLAFEITEFTFKNAEDILTLRPIFTPAHTSQRELQWLSTNEQVATVDGATGAVTAHSNGTATIIAKSIYGDFSASCVVTVDQNIPVTGISLENKSYTFRGLGQIYLITPTFSPANASNKTVLWTSSDPSVATVSDSGIVTSVKRGEATIRLETQDGGFTAEFSVSVNPNDRISVTGVSLSDYTLVFDSLGQSKQISASVVPSNATEKGVRFVSRNTAVAKVTNEGLITAVGFGTTQVSVTSVDGGYSELCTVTVNAPVIEIPPSVPEAEYVKGVWISTVANIDFPSRSGLSADQLKAEIDTIMNNVATWGLNTVYFQVRPSGDALYPSKYYPTSYYVVKNQGDELPLDILAYAIEAAHARGIQFHAWLNPYRVTNAKSFTLDHLAATNPAKAHPEWVLTDGTKLYLNPGIPEVRQYIIDGALEIVKNYDVDGIHFDDYFYPSVNEHYDDSAAYQQYGNGLSLADWRRSNNDALVKNLYNAIKEYDASVIFGISPAPVWALKYYQPEGVDIKAAHQTYSDAYADTLKWVKSGWLDYICPQVYFARDHATPPFAPIVDWWDKTVKDTGVSLYIGMGAYRCEDTAAYQTGLEIPAQLDYMDTKENVDGAVFFTYGSLLKNFAGVGDQVKVRYYTAPISTTLQFNQSSIRVDSSYKTAYVVGISDPHFPLYADGKLVERTKEGLFSYRVTLTGNTTTVRFVHKDQTVDYVITRTSSGGGSGNYLDSFSFASGKFTPTYDVADKSGVQIEFSCVAPAGSDVKVQVGGYSVPLTTSTADPNNGKYLKATYKGTLTLPQIDGDGNATLGYAVFTATRGEESVSNAPGALVEVINDPSSYAMEVSVDKSDIRPNLEADPTLYYIATQGAKVNVVSKKDGTVKLTNGMYLSTADVTVSDRSFTLAKVNSAALQSSGKYSVLSLKMTERAFHTVWMGTRSAEITLYGIAGDLPEISLGENPLFAAVKTERIDETTVRVTLEYKTSKHIYGYYCNFDGTSLYVNFRNPVTLAEGEKPLIGVTVSLDPGHSQSSGAVYLHNGVPVWESKLAMTLSKLTAEKLTAMGATVVLTHQGEQTYSLDELIVQYRALSPDVNVSIHFNAAESLATGTETFWCYGNSQLLGETVLKTFTEQTGFRSRKNACDYYKVSRLCEFPSILFETAFMSNPSDLAYFMDDANMDKAATAIAQGILNFFLEQNN